MRNSKHQIELFKNFQKKKKLFEDILYINVNVSLYNKEPKGLDFFSFLLFESGEGTHTIDSVVYEIKPKQLHLLYPGQLHSWEINGDVKIHLIFVSGRLFNSFSNNLVYPEEFYKKYPVIPLRGESFEKTLYEFKGIRDELFMKKGIREIMFSRLKILALLISREAQGFRSYSKTHSGEPLLERFAILVLSNFRSERRVKFYAGHLNITANYLNMLCRNHFGITATSFILKEVTNEIKRELLTARKSIKEISNEMNFSDLASFSAFFKKRTGLSPRAFIFHNKELSKRIKFTD